MRVLDVFKGIKTDVKIGPWKSGKIPAADFRLRRNMKPIRHGSSYRWQLIRFASDGMPCRVLVVLNQEKEIYRATLGQDVDDEVRIICVREFHVKEPGWHCHTVLRCEHGVSSWLHGEMKRLPPQQDDEAVFEVTSDERATALAMRFYRIDISGPLL